MAVRWTSNETDWPIVRLELPPEARVREIDHDSFYGLIEALLAKGGRFATLQDMRPVGIMDPMRRKRYTDWVRAREPALRRHLIAHAMVVDSNLQRGVTTAVLWVVEPPVPIQQFTDPDEARAWLKEKVSSA